MNTIRQYRPAFIETDEKLDRSEFETWNDLLEIPWIHKFAQDPNFHQFSVSRDTLIAEYRGGREWWVVGFLGAPDPTFPEWNHGIYEVEIDGKRHDMPGDMVSWSAGDQVCLKDGRMAQRIER